nr:hypothetical protein [Candidatus Sigynarchaeota archaeon]
MLLHEEMAIVPDWQDINLIIKDLRNVLDSIESSDDDNRKFRPAIARTIAMMREEKTREGQLRMARNLARQLSSFKLKDGGLIDALACENDWNYARYIR